MNEVSVVKDLLLGKNSIQISHNSDDSMSIYMRYEGGFFKKKKIKKFLKEFVSYIGYKITYTYKLNILDNPLSEDVFIVAKIDFSYSTGFSHALNNWQEYEKIVLNRS